MSKKQTYILYKISSPSGKVYVGRTIQPFKVRMNDHRTDSFKERKRKSCRKLDNSTRKYGWKNMTCEIIQKFSSEKLLDDMEINFIRFWDLLDQDKGMNLTKGGYGIYGYKHSEETRKKMSESKKGKPSSRKGCTLSKETRKKISEANKGNKPRLGCKLSEETKRKISEGNKGKKHSEESKKKMSIAAMGRMGRMGTKHTEETKKKMSDAKPKKPVKAFDKDSGLFVAWYYSMAEAAKDTGILKRNICTVCQGKRKSAGGFKWEYSHSK